MLKLSPLPSRKQAISRVVALKGCQPWPAVGPLPTVVLWVPKPFCLRGTQWVWPQLAFRAWCWCSWHGLVPIPPSRLLSCWGAAAAAWWQLGKLRVFPKWPLEYSSSRGLSSLWAGWFSCGQGGDVGQQCQCQHAGCASDQGGGRWQIFTVVLWLFLGYPWLYIPPCNMMENFSKVSGIGQNPCILDFTTVLQLGLFPCSVNPNLWSVPSLFDLFVCLYLSKVFWELLGKKTHPANVKYVL